jgi:peptide deformylase
MAILNILEFPDSRLRTIAKPVAVVDDKVRQLVDDMFETMYEAPGIGLAATQVNASASWSWTCRKIAANHGCSSTPSSNR